MPSPTIAPEDQRTCTTDLCTLDDMLGGNQSVDWSVKAELERRLNGFLGDYGLLGVALVVSELRMNKGLRLRSLEEALSVHRVVLSGSVGFANSSLKDILRGKFTGEVESGSVKLRIRW